MPPSRPGVPLVRSAFALALRMLVVALALGRYTFPHPTVTVHALPPGFPAEPLLGAVVLQNFVVTLDQRHGRLQLEREGGTEVELPRPVAR